MTTAPGPIMAASSGHVGLGHTDDADARPLWLFIVPKDPARLREIDGANPQPWPLRHSQYPSDEGEGLPRSKGMQSGQGMKSGGGNMNPDQKC